MSKVIQKSSLIIVLALISWSFSFVAGGAEPPALAKLSGVEKKRVTKLIEEAKKEGKLAGYSSDFRPDVQAELFPKFREWYGLSEADLQINFVSMRSDAIITKVDIEFMSFHIVYL